MTKYTFLSEDASLQQTNNNNIGRTLANGYNSLRLVLWFSDLMSMLSKNIDEKRFETLYQLYPNKNAFIKALKDARAFYSEKANYTKVTKINTLIRSLRFVIGDRGYKKWLRTKCGSTKILDALLGLFSLLIAGVYTVYKAYKNSKASQGKSSLDAVISRG